MKFGRVSVKELTLSTGMQVLSGAETPVNGVTGRNAAGPGSLYAKAVEGDAALYLNVGTKASPVWKQLRTVD